MKSKEQIIKILSTKKAFLRERFGVEALLLFGSYAKDQQREESDVDLLYEVAPNGTMPLMRLQNLEHYIAELLQIKKVELVRRKYAEPVIYSQIEKHGIAIF